MLPERGGEAEKETFLTERVPAGAPAAPSRPCWEPGAAGGRGAAPREGARRGARSCRSSPGGRCGESGRLSGSGGAAAGARLSVCPVREVLGFNRGKKPCSCQPRALRKCVEPSIGVPRSPRVRGVRELGPKLRNNLKSSSGKEVKLRRLVCQRVGWMCVSEGSAAAMLPDSGARLLAPPAERCLPLVREVMDANACGAAGSWLCSGCGVLCAVCPRVLQLSASGAALGTGFPWLPQYRRAPGRAVPARGGPETEPRSRGGFQKRDCRFLFRSRNKENFSAPAFGSERCVLVWLRLSERRKAFKGLMLSVRRPHRLRPTA